MIVVADDITFVEHPGNAERPNAVVDRPIASLHRPSGWSRSLVHHLAGDLCQGFELSVRAGVIGFVQGRPARARTTPPPPAPSEDSRPATEGRAESASQ